MALKSRKKAQVEGDNNIFWTTMSDLLLGLAIIFMTLSEQIANRLSIRELIENLKEANIEAQVDKTTGDVKISDMELFELGSANLSPKGKAYLSKLVPIYINTIFSKKELIGEIENIIIQGHTDSHTFSGIKNPDISYMKNMELSTARANAVANYVFQTNYDKQYNPKLRKMLIVEGRSYSDPVLVNGKEDYDKSRRVEMRLKVKIRYYRSFISWSSIAKK